MKVALVSPPNTRAARYVSENAPPPLGICYLASMLRAAGFEADLFDFAEIGDPSEQYLDGVSFFNYDIYGFTSYTKTFTATLDILRHLRRHNERAVVVFGGPHASPCAREILTEYIDIDCVIRNEGELSMLALVRHLTDGTPALSEISNLTYRNGGLPLRLRGVTPETSLAIRETPPTDELLDLDTLPFPYREFKVEPNRVSLEYRRHSEPVEVAFISSSRGCPKKCSFCSIVVMSPKYRFRSVESLMAEIFELYARRPFGHINFLDANFFCHVPRTLEFSRTLYSWNPDITWSGTATADTVARHAEILPEIGRLNCSFLEIGIESGNSATLARFNKRTTVEQNREAIRLLQQAGIELALDFIMFDPETSLADLRENLMFLWECDLFGYSPPECLFNEMRLYPGTPARDKYLNFFGLEKHHLKSLIPPFQDAAVEEAHRRANDYLRLVQDRSMQMIQALESERHSLLRAKRHPSAATIKRAQLCATIILKLRHNPYRFFDIMLTDLENHGPGNNSTEGVDQYSIDLASALIMEGERLIGSL